MSAVELARREWEDANRELEAQAHDRARYERLLEAVEVVTDELRKRVGQTFSLGELAEAYGGADTWVRDVVGEHAPSPGWVRWLTTVEGGAFFQYSHGATDYEP